MFLMQRMTRCLKNRFYPMIVAIGIILATSIPLYMINETTQNLVYPLIGLQGISLAILLNTSTALISDVIGKNSENSAFVYGSYSLIEKFVNGIILYFMLEHL